VLRSGVGVKSNASCAVLDGAAAQLEAYFGGELTAFDVPEGFANSGRLVFVDEPAEQVVAS